jgi:hypothetical protein
VTLSGGPAWFAPHPRCPVHGRMSLVPRPERGDGTLGPLSYRCAGWDGEGCDHVVAEGELEWQRLGVLEPMEITIAP